ncbi:MAG TPA: hypothetical protein PK096_02310 [Candidatus Saccharibacteria bacterium]|nr:hypothetical protein [Candidatus Saccharibacteria bacterium]HRK94178.1 hypothetical protein [Candidatus Saccharibacteria bacterium]
MTQQRTVAINGVQYDPHTGLPITKGEASAVAVQKELQRVQSVHAKGIHKNQQRSNTLNRQFVKKSPQKSVGRVVDIRRPSHARSPHITKFAKPAVHPQANVPVSRDIAHVAHPHVAKVHAQTAPPVATQPRPAHEIKHQAISKALENARPHEGIRHETKPRGRKMSIVTACLGLFLIGAYFTYINMPSLSVRVAAAQAGIDASYPEYRPIGYRLNGPVAYRDGEVTMQFASNSGPQHFALAQTKSSWDSTALLEKFVNPRSNGHYATYTDAGLTIYTYGNNAAWVNGGILYSVEGNATLSNEQVRRMATSM